jgi:hypothetical protein
MRAPTTICLLLALAGGAASAGDIYRWVDKDGKAHLSDRPPADPPKNMTRQDSREFDISTQRHGEALQRAEKEKARVRAMEEERVRRERAQAPRPTRAAPSRGVAMPGPDASCAQRWEAYQRSGECFGPYRTANGGLKPEAFTVCGQPVPDPAPQCGQQ